MNYMKKKISLNENKREEWWITRLKVKIKNRSILKLEMKGGVLVNPT